MHGVENVDRETDIHVTSLKVKVYTLSCSRLLEIEKSSRTQGKVLAKMEGLRKKQACTPEELSKLRKVVDKHHRAADKHGDGTLAEQRYLRRSDRKAGKSRKIDIDRKVCTASFCVYILKYYAYLPSQKFRTKPYPVATQLIIEYLSDCIF